MKLAQYAKEIAELAEKYPNARIAFIDENEGELRDVYHSPRIGKYNEQTGEFVTEDDTEIAESEVNYIFL